MGAAIRSALFCPKCGSEARQRWEVRPDLAGSDEDRRERRTCFDCGWTTRWVRYGTVAGVRREAR